ncbi:MAG: AI-2E family transporter [Thermoplasmatota archaeon]
MAEPPASPDRDLTKTRRNFLLLLLVALAVLAWLIFEPFLSYALLGVLLAYLLAPLHARLAKRIPAGISAGLLVLLAFAILIVPFVLVAIEFARIIEESAASLSASDFQSGIQSALTNAYSLVGLPAPAPGAAEALIARALVEGRDFLAARAPAALAFAGSLVLGIFILLFVAYYGLAEGRAGVAYARSLSPLTPKQTDHLVGSIRSVVDAVLVGQVGIAALQGLMGALGFWIFGVPHAAFWGFVMGVLALLPAVGAPLVWLPASVALAAQGHAVAALLLFVYSLLFVQLAEYVLRPYVIGRRADVHPIVVLVGALGGIEAFGIVGFFVGPVVLALLIAVLNFWRDEVVPSAKAHPRIQEE